MKKFYLVTLALSPFMANAQMLKPDSNTREPNERMHYYLTDTVAKSALSKNQLYENALNVLANSFKDMPEITFKDTTIGQISFTGDDYKMVTENISKKRKKPDSVQLKMYLFFKGKIFVKDHKFKIVFYELKRPFDPIVNTVTFPVQPAAAGENDSNKVARELAIELIRKMTAKMNKPADF